MVKRRSCYAVIERMLGHVPADNTRLIDALKWHLEDSMYKAPEETIQWERTMSTLQKFIPNPSEDWHFNVLSIFTTKSIEELKLTVKRINELESRDGQTNKI